MYHPLCFCTFFDFITSWYSWKPNITGNHKARTLQKICLENKRMYTELYGLHLVIGTPSNAAEAQKPRLLKVKWILHLLSTGYETVFYLDLDTLILDANYDIRPNILGMSSPLAISMDFNKYSGRRHQKREKGHAKDITDVKRFNTGVMILQNHHLVTDFLHKIYEEGMKIKGDISDQKLFNLYIRDFFPTNKFLTLLDRVKWNAFPMIEDDRYKFMGHILGDEVTNTSYIIHFAGIYGGASQEKGITEPVAMLVVYKELVTRQIGFLSTLSYEATQTLGLAWEKAQVNVNRKLSIVRKYEMTKLTLDECISRVFSDFDIDRADKLATSCIEKVLS